MTKEFRNIKYNSEKKELTASVDVLGWLMEEAELRSQYKVGRIGNRRQREEDVLGEEGPRHGKKWAKAWKEMLVPYITCITPVGIQD